MIKALIAYLTALALEKRTDTARKVAYDAVAYSVECAAEATKKGEILTSRQKMNLALDYFAAMLPGIPANEAQMYCKSILAKVVGAGATGGNKI